MLWCLGSNDIASLKLLLRGFQALCVGNDAMLSCCGL